MADGYIGIVDATIGKRQEHSVTGTGADAVYRLRVDTYPGNESAQQSNLYVKNVDSGLWQALYGRGCAATARAGLNKP